MDFRFSEAEKKIMEVATKFAETEVEPLAEEIDANSIFPEETFQKMVECGFTGIGTPVEYGGSGGDDVAKIIVVSEIAKKCASTAGILSIHQPRTWPGQRRHDRNRFCARPRQLRH